MAVISSETVRDIKRDLRFSSEECLSRGLINSAKWAAELALSLHVVPAPDTTERCEDKSFLAEYDEYLLGKSHFDNKEFERAAFHLEQCTSSKCRFLWNYSTYLAGEKKKNDQMTDLLGPLEQNSIKNENLPLLRLYFSQWHKSLDGFGFYMYGVVLKELGLKQEALKMFVEAVEKEPLFWGSWIEIALLCNTKEELQSLVLPKHWMKMFFDAHAALEFQQNAEAVQLYSDLLNSNFAKSTYVLSQLAIAQYNMRDFDAAVDHFNEIRQDDPYCLDNMDTYSNILYVKDMRPELSHLARHCFEVDKYRVETCCVVGNFYSLQSCHEKAILYFQRALRLNPRYLSAWTLMGHEYMEMKNTSAAIASYRQAVEVSQRDYRAWYGLGQTYEILKMPLYSLYYFSQAQKLRPNDSRMVVALGECYLKLNRPDEAKKCYRRAIAVGDFDDIAVLQLARLHEKLLEEEDAVKYYSSYVQKVEVRGVFCSEDLPAAYKFLARHFIGKRKLDEAVSYAQKCCDYGETREDGKVFLRQISELRAVSECTSTPVNRLSDRLDLHTSETNISPMNLTFSP